MRLHRLVLTELESNGYLLSRNGKGALVVDAGGEGGRIVNWLDDHALTPEWIVCTHGHADHIGGNAHLKKVFPHVRIAIGKADAPLLGSAIRNMSVLMGWWVRSPKADLELSDGDHFHFQDLVFDVIGVSGHTPGGICLYAELPEPDRPPILFTGDTLFAGGIGRSDIPGGNQQLLIHSIRRKLLTLPPETVVYPGHGPATTIAAEATGNPWLRAGAP